MHPLHAPAPTRGVRQGTGPGLCAGRGEEEEAGIRGGERGRNPHHLPHTFPPSALKRTPRSANPVGGSSGRRWRGRVPPGAGWNQDVGSANARERVLPALCLRCGRESARICA